MRHLKERASIVIIRPASRSDAVENVREDQALEEMMRERCPAHLDRVRPGDQAKTGRRLT
jgi:hypothetical protein